MISAIRSKLTVPNVIATLALFLALGGGAAYAAGGLGRHAVKSKNLAKHAVKRRNIARNAVTGSKVKKKSLRRSDLSLGARSGLEVADAQATNVPGLATDPPPSGSPLGLSGNTSFKPKKGRSYVLLAELRGNPIDADGAGGGYGGSGCYASVVILVGGEPIASVEISANANASPPYNVNPIGTTSTAVGLLEAGQTQPIGATVYGDSGCGSATTANLRVVVAQLG